MSCCVYASTVVWYISPKMVSVYILHHVHLNTTTLPLLYCVKHSMLQTELHIAEKGAYIMCECLL